MTAFTKTRKPIKAIKVWPYIFCLPFIFAYTVFSLFPTVYSLVLSFFDWNGITEKIFVGFKNYIQLFTHDVLFWKSIKNTIILMGISTPVTVFLGLLTAYLLFDISRGKHFYQTVNFFPYITTPVAIGFIFSYLFDYQTGYVNQLLQLLKMETQPYYWLNNVWSTRMIVIIMIVWRYLGYYMTLYLASMTTIPFEIYEAARVDGANSFTIFRKITIPLLKNITAFLVITSIIGGLQMFEEPKLLFSGWAAIGGISAGGPDNCVLTTVWLFYNDSFKLDSRLGYGSAIAYALFLLILIFSVVGFRISYGKKDRNE